MKRIVTIFDFLAFVLFGALFAAGIFLLLSVLSIFKKRRWAEGKINRFSFVIFDPTSEAYPSLMEEALLGGYISNDYSIYLDFNNRSDRYRKIENRINFYAIAAHPDNGIYNAGLYKINMLLTEVRILARAWSVIRKNKISFIKAHDPHILGLNGLIMSRLFRLPCILHMNSDFDMKYLGTGRISSPIFISRSVERLFESVIINSYDAIMADREFYKNSRNFPKKSVCKYKAVGVRVDRRHYAPPEPKGNNREELGLGTKKVLLYVGRLHPVKYPEDAVNAFSIIKKEFKDAVLLVVGTGILKDKLDRIVKTEGLEGSILFLGAKSQEEMVDIFRTADVFIAPHGGVTLVESALAATPSVAYDFDWHAEFLEDNNMGFIVKFKDVEGMAMACLKLLKNDLMREEFGRRSRQMALDKCDRTKSLDREKEIYSALLEGRGFC